MVSTDHAYHLHHGECHTFIMVSTDLPQLPPRPLEPPDLARLSCPALLQLLLAAYPFLFWHLYSGLLRQRSKRLCAEPGPPLAHIKST